MRTSLNHFNSMKKQSGVTLVEIVVSIFVLSIGILALLAMQTRSLNSINQAENIFEVSQAVDNLAQGMIINPELSIELEPQGYTTKKNYNYYNFQGCQNTTNNTKAAEYPLTKPQLAQQQLVDFCQEISAIKGINPKDIQVKVCTNSNITGNLKWDFSCDGTGIETIIKVVWLYQTQTRVSNKETQLDNDVINKENKIILSYEIPLTQ